MYLPIKPRIKLTQYYKTYYEFIANCQQHNVANDPISSSSWVYNVDCRLYYVCIDPADMYYELNTTGGAIGLFAFYRVTIILFINFNLTICSGEDKC